MVILKYWKRYRRLPFEYDDFIEKMLEKAKCLTLRWPQHNFYVNCHTQLPAIGYKSNLVPKHHKRS